MNNQETRTLHVSSSHPALLVFALCLEFVVAVATTGIVFALFGQLQLSLTRPWGSLTMALMVFPLAGLVWVFHRFRSRLSLAEVGFTTQGWRLAQLPLGLALALLLSAIALFLTSFLAPAVQITTRLASVTPMEWAVVLALAGGTSIWEECVFRAMLLPRLLQVGIPFHFATLLSVALFTAVHLPIQTKYWLFFVFATGYLLTYLYYLSGTIWLPIGAHTGFNVIRWTVNTDTGVNIRNLTEHMPLLTTVWTSIIIVGTIPMILQNLKRLPESALPVARDSLARGAQGQSDPSSDF